MPDRSQCLKTGQERFYFLGISHRFLEMKQEYGNKIMGDGLSDLQALIGAMVSFAARSEKTKIPPAVRESSGINKDREDCGTHTHTLTEPGRSPSQPTADTNPH